MRDGKFERLGGFEIYCEGKRRRLLERQIGRLGSAEDAVDQPGNQSSRLRSIGAIGHQTAIPDEGAMFIHRRDAVDGGELENPLAVQHGQHVRITIMIPSGFSRVIEANAASKSSGSRTPSAEPGCLI